MVSEVSVLLKQKVFFTPQELKKYGVTTVVRVCEATYDTAPVEKEGIQVLVSSVEAELKNSLRRPPPPPRNPKPTQKPPKPPKISFDNTTLFYKNIPADDGGKSCTGILSCEEKNVHFSAKSYAQ